MGLSLKNSNQLNMAANIQRKKSNFKFFSPFKSIIIKMLFIHVIILFSYQSYAQTTQWKIIWSKNSENNISHYKLYRSIGSPNASRKYGENIDHYDASHTLNDSLMFYVDTNLEKGQLIYYRIKAVNDIELASDYSDEISAAIPSINLTIPEQKISINENFTDINLDNYVLDPDHADNQLVWTVENSENLTINIQNRVASISRNDPGWIGTEEVTFVVTDPDGFYDQQNVSFQIENGENSYPVITAIPDQKIRQGESFNPLNLDNYVFDADNDDSELEWSFSGNSNLAVDINSNHIVSVSVEDTSWSGEEIITFIVTDPDGNSNSIETVFIVRSRFAPIVSNIPNQIINQGEYFSTIYLDNYVQDPDDADNLITWSFSGNSELSVVIDQNRAATISVINQDWTGSETIRFIATDPDGYYDYDDVVCMVEIPSYDRVNAFPIPFKAEASINNSITFTNLPLNGELIIFDLLGNPLFKNKIMTHTYLWDVKNQAGKNVSSGVYLFVVLDDKDDKKDSGKLVIVR